MYNYNTVCIGGLMSVEIRDYVNYLRLLGEEGITSEDKILIEGILRSKSNYTRENIDYLQTLYDYFAYYVYKTEPFDYGTRGSVNNYLPHFHSERLKYKGFIRENTEDHYNINEGIMRGYFKRYIIEPLERQEEPDIKKLLDTVNGCEEVTKGRVYAIGKHMEDSYLKPLLNTLLNTGNGGVKGIDINKLNNIKDIMILRGE